MANRADDAGLLDAAFHHIRQAGAGHPAVLIHLADMIGKLASAVRTELQHKALNDQLERLFETARLGTIAQQDRADISARIGSARLALADVAVSHPHERNKLPPALLSDEQHKGQMR